MTTEQETSGEEPEPAAGRADHLTRSTVIACATVIIGLVGWFFFAWLVLERNVVDAVGESIGTALVALLIVSIIGVTSRSHR
jgi:hypothetical protein